MSFYMSDSNDLDCTQIQCPTKCPEDSYLKSALDDEEEDFDDYEDELFGHDSYIEQVGHFEEVPPEVALYDSHDPEHILKERQKREVFFQEDIERCCDDQKCVCNKCPDVPKCIDGQVAVEIHEGLGRPGNCCSVFRCAAKEVCQLGVKQTWWKNKCTKCSCFGENELCLQICPDEEILQNCYSEYWQKPIMNGASWKEGKCTSCFCEQGDRRCLTPVCPKLDCKETIDLEDECCPKCVNSEIEERFEILHNKDIVKEHVTETTNIIEENNLTKPQNHSSFPVVNRNVLNETQTTSVLESSTVSVIQKTTEKTSSTFRPQPVELLEENVSSTDFTTLTPLLSSTLSSVVNISSTSVATSTEESKSTAQLEHVSSTTTDEPKTITEHEHNSSTIITSTEEPKSIMILAQDLSSSTTEPAQTYPATNTGSPAEKLTTETTSVDNAVTNTTLETSKSTSASSTEVTSTSEMISTSTTAAPIGFSATTTVGSATPSYNAFTTTPASDDATKAFSIISSTSTATETTTLAESITTKASTSSTRSMTTNTPSDLTKEATSIYTTSAPTLTKYYTSSILTLTSTTSSPYSSNTTTSILKHASPSTTAPEPVIPLFQSYGDFNSNEQRVYSTQNQMRIMFDEIDYVVMIGLFMGALLCITLGLIIRHTKNRKKMYSSIPNSETSLSQTSTNTVLTV